MQHLADHHCHCAYKTKPPFLTLCQAPDADSYTKPSACTARQYRRTAAMHKGNLDDFSSKTCVKQHQHGSCVRAKHKNQIKQDKIRKNHHSQASYLQLVPGIAEGLGIRAVAGAPETCPSLDSPAHILDAQHHQQRCPERESKHPGRQSALQ